MSALGPSPQSNGDYSPPPPPPTESPNGGLATGLPIVLTVGIVMGVLIVIVAVRFCVIRRRKKRRRGDNNGSDGLAHGAEGVASKPLMKRGLDLRPSQISFSYEELSIDQFSDANLIGEGGFGLVHKGVLPNGKAVAIKHMKSGSVQGEREFRAEVEIISRVHHKHLVSLIGYCVAGAQRMLVYEFIPNFTLYFHLHGKERPVMNWPTRMKIALGSLQKDWHICTRTVTQRSYIVTSRQLIFFWIKTLTQRLQILGLLSFQQILIPMSPLG